MKHIELSGHQGGLERGEERACIPGRSTQGRYTLVYMPSLGPLVGAPWPVCAPCYPMSVPLYTRSLLVNDRFSPGGEEEKPRCPESPLSSFLRITEILGETGLVCHLIPGPEVVFHKEVENVRTSPRVTWDTPQG